MFYFHIFVLLKNVNLLGSCVLIDEIVFMFMLLMMITALRTSIQVFVNGFYWKYDAYSVEPHTTTTDKDNPFAFHYIYFLVNGKKLRRHAEKKVNEKG